MIFISLFSYRNAEKKLYLTFRKQEKFGTFYRNVPTENAFSNILKSSIKNAKPKFLLLAVICSAVIKFLQRKQPQFIFQKTFHFFSFRFQPFLFQVNEMYQVNEMSERTIFKRCQAAAKAIDNSF